MTTKKERQDRLAKEAFRSVFQTDTERGRAPTIAPIPPPPEPKQPKIPVERKPLKADNLELAEQIQRKGFTSPHRFPCEFKAVMITETKATALIVYEVFARSVGWSPRKWTRGDPKWIKISHESFKQACGMPPGQVNLGLKNALSKGYIERKECLGPGFEYRARFKDQQGE